MIDIAAFKNTLSSSSSRIIMLVVDGLGGLPHPSTRKSELETAVLPNLDCLAFESACGLTNPVLPGVTPGSGPGHLALFGYDPLKYNVGRGALEAMGVDGIDFQKGDVVARGNFCTVDARGLVIDRRAGRISSEFSIPLCRELGRIEMDLVDIKVYPVKDHRFVLRIRGGGLSDNVTDMDPQRTGVPLQDVKHLADYARKTADVVNEFVSQARHILAEEERANMVMLRGFSDKPALPSMGEAYKLKPAAIAGYPMYRGLAAIVGMEVLATGLTFDDEVDTLVHNYEQYDFFFIHYKEADTAGEDGDFAAKVKALEDLDSLIPRLVDLNPDVLVVTGDHSTPSIMAAHSWHPVPFSLRSPWTKGEGMETFDERSFSRGSLGIMPAVNIMNLALAHSGKLGKFGA